MKKYTLTAFFLVSIYTFESTAQDTTTRSLKNITFRTEIYSSGSTSNGYLTNVGDSALLFSHSRVKFNPSTEIAHGVTAIPYGGIDKMVIQRKGAGKNGALIGGLSCMVIGIVAGFMAGSDPIVPPEEDFLGFGNMFNTTAGEKAFAGGLTGLIGGGLIGSLIGNLAKKKFIIGGKKEIFDDMRQVILNKAYQKTIE